MSGFDCRFVPRRRKPSSTANYTGADINHINFNIPGLTVETEITLTETLFIARPMVINATTQPGYAGRPLIRINCNRLPSGFHVVPAGSGLPGGGGSTIQGFRIMNYTSNAVTLSRGADANVIADNYIGFAPLPVPGTYFKNTTIAPECRGIGIESSANIIRGNTISGVHNGITLAGDPSGQPQMLCRQNSIERNFIGTDPTGEIIIGNDSDGIFLTGSAQENLIGPGNVLSGMASAGVELLHEATTGNRIFGNIIGLNATGTTAIPNGELGILIAGGASNNWIGGPFGGIYPGNIISASGFGGVAIGTPEFPGPDGSNDNHIEGNVIGADRAETKAVGTQISGVTIQNKSKRNIIRKNVIVGHVHHGVVFAGVADNAMYGNWIGVTSKGTTLGNAGFGAFVADSSNNIVQPSAASAAPGKEQNVFGSNLGGSVGLFGASSGNVIELTAPTPSPTATPSPTPVPTPTPGARLLNISTRMRVETGDNALIAGFIISGNAPKKVLIRGIGPSLPVSGALADPTLDLDDGTISNDDWQSSQEAEVRATLIPPTSELESAIVATLQPGGHTAVLRGKNGGTGVGLVEVYDLESGTPVQLANISTRGQVQTDDDVMIGGFIIGGAQPAKVLLRAIGPSLPVEGALQDPTLELVDPQGNVFSNDNWRAIQEAEITSILPPSADREAALLAMLPPGAYTAIIRGKDNTTGIALIEGYNLQ